MSTSYSSAWAPMLEGWCCTLMAPPLVTTLFHGGSGSSPPSLGLWLNSLGGSAQQNLEGGCHLAHCRHRCRKNWGETCQAWWSICLECFSVGGASISMMALHFSASFIFLVVSSRCGQAIASRWDYHYADSPRCDGLPTSKGVSMKIWRMKQSLET